MTIIKTAGLATAALAVAACFTPVTAADLDGYGKRGSIKDAPPPAYHAPVRGPSGPCYFRGDLGYSASRNPSVSWPVSNIDNTATPPTYTYVGDEVSNTSMENAWFGGMGLGCGMGSHGIRGEVMFNVYANRKIDGVPHDFTVTNAGPVIVPVDDPLHTSLKSHTLMFNAYKDLGNWNGITPYVGAGVGVAYNQLGETYFTQNVFLTNRIEGDSRLSMAWSLMAGIGWQITDRAILDLGYRYMDFGKAQSGRVDNAGFVNPAVKLDDITAHEFKVGLRYHFGGSSDCCAHTQPMK